MDSKNDCMSIEEFDFILKRVHLQKKQLIEKSSMGKFTFYADQRESKANNFPVKEYWIEVLLEIIGEIPFSMARNSFQMISKQKSA